MSNPVGRPRDESKDRYIFDAVLEILEEKGYSGLKMDTVATRAGISKNTLYIRYSSPIELTIGLLRHYAAGAPLAPDTGSLESDLRAMLYGLRKLFESTPIGTIIPTLVGASMGNAELVTEARAYIETRRRSMEPIIERAIERGELPKTTNPKEAIELCVAPLYYRHLISGEPIDDEFIKNIISRLISSVARQGI